MERTEKRPRFDISNLYEYRRGSIAVVDGSTGYMRCMRCKRAWWSRVRRGGGYERGSWTCQYCGASSKDRVTWQAG
jgi:hypothetical protein